MKSWLQGLYATVHVIVLSIRSFVSLSVAKQFKAMVSIDVQQEILYMGFSKNPFLDPLSDSKPRSVPD